MSYFTKPYIGILLTLLLSVAGCKKLAENNIPAFEEKYSKELSSQLSLKQNTQYRLMPYANTESNKVIEVAGLSSEDSAHIQVWTWQNLPSQKWKAAYTDSGYFYFTNALSGKVLTAPSATYGKQLVQTTYKNNPFQLWKLDFVPAQNIYGFTNKTGIVAALQTNTVANGTPVITDARKREVKQAFVIQKLFNNPLRSSGADPWVVQRNGWYYYTNTTGGNITLFKTKEISELNFAESKVVYTPPAGQPYSKNLWAPEMHFLDNKWYIYFAADDGIDANHRMYVLENESEDPTTGSWIFKGKISDPSDIWAIDGSVFEMHNKRYFIWSGWRFQNTSQSGIQQIYIAEMSNPWTISGNRILISEPTYNWEKIGLVNEGPEILKNAQGEIFLIYSCCGCWTDDYKLGMLKLSGNSPLFKENWTKTPEPVFSKNISNSVYAPGHNSFFTSPDSSENWIMYHANSASGQGCGGFRSPRMQQFTWHADGSPSFGIPVATSESLPVPKGEKL